MLEEGNKFGRPDFWSHTMVHCGVNRDLVQVRLAANQSSEVSLVSVKTQVEQEPRREETTSTCER